MRRKLFLLATSAAICLSLPAVSPAAPPDSRNQPGAPGD